MVVIVPSQSRCILCLGLDIEIGSLPIEIGIHGGQKKVSRIRNEQALKDEELQRHRAQLLSCTIPLNSHNRYGECTTALRSHLFRKQSHLNPVQPDCPCQPG